MDDTNSLIEQRRAKLTALRTKGIDPSKNKFTPAESCADARKNYAEDRETAVAGRITAHREMGKSMFIDMRDQSARQGRPALPHQLRVAAVHFARQNGGGRLRRAACAVHQGRTLQAKECSDAN
jgi:lysyl-tRNA synthetase class II